MTAGFNGAGAPSITLRAPTFGDWLICGDISRQTVNNPRDSSGEVAVEFRTSPHAVAAWLQRLSGLDAAALSSVPLSTARLAFAQLVAMVPAFDQVEPQDVPLGQDINIKLTRPIEHHRGTHEIITVRVPRFGDWIEAGDPYTQRALEPQADAGFQPRALEIKLDEKAVGLWFQHLTGLAAPILAQLSYEDARRIFAVMKPMLRDIDAGNFAPPPMNSGLSAA